MKNSWFCCFMALVQVALYYLDFVSAFVAFTVGVGFILVSQICSSIESLQNNIRDMKCDYCEDCELHE